MESHETIPHSICLPSHRSQTERSGNGSRGGKFCRARAKQQLAKLGFCWKRPCERNSWRRNHFAQFWSYLALIAILTGCGAANSWKYEAIETGNPLFDSARLTFADSSSPLRFEMMRTHSGIEAFLSLTQYSFTPQNEILVTLKMGGVETPIEELLPLLKGNMRLRLPAPLLESLTQALQEGREVAILVDGFEENLTPGHFIREYEKLLGNTLIFKSPFKGIFNQ